MVGWWQPQQRPGGRKFGDRLPRVNSKNADLIKEDTSGNRTERTEDHAKHRHIVETSKHQAAADHISGGLWNYEKGLDKIYLAVEDISTKKCRTVESCSKCLQKKWENTSKKRWKPQTNMWSNKYTSICRRWNTEKSCSRHDFLIKEEENTTVSSLVNLPNWLGIQPLL